ncbi:MAG: flagellar filament capping protein FliD [Selenomonadaceae bacterium]|nr:flagellar filament capping protein FliD [Selenomonadaceae bacterium]MBR4153542.1 flagellar filament capping protein FliD [Selenomonadaceae bacterium]
MATINSMIRTGNLSMFSDYAANNNRGTARNSLNAIWQRYTSSTNNAASTAAGISEVRQNASELMSAYDTTKQTFYNEFDDNMDALRISAAAVRNFNFNVGENAVTQTENVASDGTRTTTTTYSDAMRNALDTVRNLVNDYNEARSFLSDNAAVSSRVERMAQNFGDTTYRAGSYESIGISVRRNGALTIDEETLARAINKNPSRVANVLGRNGLADTAERNVETAKAQRDRLFPEAKSMFGDQFDAVALYTGRAFVDMTTISNIGNLVNIMF